jgi:hypothetical protein
MKILIIGSAAAFQVNTMTQVTDLQELANAGYPVEAFSKNSYACVLKLAQVKRLFNTILTERYYEELFDKFR